MYTGGVLAGKTLTQIVAGFSFTCALDGAGAAYCWGLDSSGQLGNNSMTQSPVPVAVSTSGVLAGQTLTQLAAGNAHVVRAGLGRAAYCWGANGNGQLGNNSTNRSLVPVAVSTSGVLAGMTLTQITAGSATPARWTPRARPTAGGPTATASWGTAARRKAWCRSR